MKKTLFTASFLSLAVCLTAGQAAALSPETEMLLNLLQSKGVISKSEAQGFKETINQKILPKADSAKSHYHTVQSLASRIDKLEKTPEPDAHGLVDKLHFSGLVEIEAGTNRIDNGTGTTTNSSDISLATAILNVNAAINPYTSAHIDLLYEEDAGNSITIDEGIIYLNGGETLPLYLKTGKMYVPFGQFESHFVTSPLPLTLGETNDIAAIIGYSNQLFEVNFGAFNGAVKETGKSDEINSFVGSAIITLPDNSIPDLVANFGISYISNLATSDELQGTVATGTGDITDIVGAYSTFGHFEYIDKYYLDIEYLSALANFTNGDLDFIDANNQKPSAWNIEMAATLMPKMELALRYGGTNEAGSSYAEDMFGAALLYDVLDNTTLNFEYMLQNFTDKSDAKSATVQLAVEF